MNSNLHGREKIFPRECITKEKHKEKKRTSAMMNHCRTWICLIRLTSKNAKISILLQQKGQNENCDYNIEMETIVDEVDKD